jgi:hypothetical protein
MVAVAQRHRKNQRCRVCDGAEGDPRGASRRCTGFDSTDGKWCHCSRDEHAGSLDQNAESLTYAHLMQGPCKCGVQHGAAIEQSDVEAVYSYTNEQGVEIFQVVRKVGKKFLQRHGDGHGRWIWKMEGVRRVLYRFPQLLAADPLRTVYIVEGERDTETAERLGIVATTGPGGAGKWHMVADLAREVLAGRNVVIIADADGPGRKHAAQVAASLVGVARAVRVVELPDAKDLSEYIVEMKMTLEDLEDVVDEAVPIRCEHDSADSAGPAPDEHDAGEPEFFEGEPANTNETPHSQRTPKTGAMPRRLGETFGPSILRAERRMSGAEKPIRLPFASLDPHFGGGLWPGLHFFVSTTGVGKTQIALQITAGACKAGVPSLYVGLELGDLDLALRVLAEEAGVKWSHLWTGTAGPACLDKVKAAAPNLADLPFHYEVSRPHGYPVSAIVAAVEAMRVQYPEESGPGSRPMLVVVDFLQLIGDEPNEEKDLRIRVSLASYALRSLAVSLNAAVVCISSTARESGKALENVLKSAALAWDTDADGCPINRRILNADAIIGLGKESGDIEYSGDSVSVLAKVPETYNGTGVDVVFATAKGRATGPTWSPLRFTGFRYEECSDRGGRMVDAWAEVAEKREAAREEKKAAKEDKKAADIRADAEAIRRFVADNPGCTVREARISAVGDSSRRWTPAVAKLGRELVQREDGRRVVLSIVEAGR